MKAFPTQGLSNMTGGQLYEAVYNPGMDLRDYFAAHAPEVPSWFERKKTLRTEALKSAEDGLYRAHTYTDLEPMKDLFIRWRYEYADLMMEARTK